MNITWIAYLVPTSEKLDVVTKVTNPRGNASLLSLRQKHVLVQCSTM